MKPVPCCGFFYQFHSGLMTFFQKTEVLPRKWEVHPWLQVPSVGASVEFKLVVDAKGQPKADSEDGARFWLLAVCSYC